MFNMQPMFKYWAYAIFHANREVTHTNYTHIHMHAGLLAVHILQ